MLHSMKKGIKTGWSIIDDLDVLRDQELDHVLYNNPEFVENGQCSLFYFNPLWQALCTVFISGHKLAIVATMWEASAQIKK